MDSLDQFIEQKMRQSGLVGIGASLIVDKEIVWAKGYGYADEANKIAFTPNTIMNIASISKTFTGVCLMKAVEDGELALDEDINAYLPFKVVNPNFPDEKITLRQLATYTSSLADRNPFYGDSTYIVGGQVPESLGSFVKNYYVPTGTHYASDNFLKARPGTFREYSNLATGLAGYIVELRTGRSLSEYARDLIFRPLNMSSTGWSLAEIDINKHTKLYKKQGNNSETIELYEGITYPDGGVRTTVTDLSRFFSCLLNEGEYKGSRILKKETVAEMIRFQHDERNRPDNVNINKLNSGIFWATTLGATRIGHNGSDPGVRTFMLADLTKEVGVILFFNTSLTEQEEGRFFDIYEELHKYGVRLKKAQTNKR